MIAPMNDCTFSVVRVSGEHQHDARQHGRHRRDDDEREPKRLEVRGQQQKDHDDRDDRPAVMFVNVSRIAAIWPRTATVAPRGGVAGARDRRVRPGRRRAPDPRRRRSPSA